MTQAMQLNRHAEGPEDTSAPVRRRRRSREDIEDRIREAARTLFAERGYMSTTTKEIARVADVSETLLFRYHGDKASLFGAVVLQPFGQLMDDFVRAHPDATSSGARNAARDFTRKVYELFERNEGIFRALLGDGSRSPDGGSRPLSGLEPFFDAAISQVSRRYQVAGIEPPYQLAVGIRLGLGMIASSVLLRDHLFVATPDREDVMIALEHVIVTALSGPPAD